jgi:hypothetical protein
LYQKDEPENVVIYGCADIRIPFVGYSHHQLGLSPRQRITPSKYGTLPEVEPEVVHPKRGGDRAISSHLPNRFGSLWLARDENTI